MSPGTISRVSQSDAVAFRVRFADTPPPREQRYWRGPVLTAYDGRTWRREPATPVSSNAPSITTNGQSLDYQITLEPHDRRWLLALDLPVQVDGAAARTPAYEYLADKPVTKLRRYAGRSYTAFLLDKELTDKQRQRLTRLPANHHPRTQALARRLIKTHDTPAAIVRAGLAWLRSHPFVYTLHPGRLTGDRIDRFLFETQRGFCELFAGSFATLMRAAGVPARVVTGYQGGEANPGTDYLIIRQSDAHAWVEVWLPNSGWRRVDPTATVAPERIRTGLGAAVPAIDAVPMMARGGTGPLHSIRLLWDRVDALWNQWVLTYGPNPQRNLLENMGLRSALEIALALTGMLMLTLLALAAWSLWPRGDSAGDPIHRAWQRYRKRLARAGIPSCPEEGPQDLADRVTREHPELTTAVTRITRRYIRLRYAECGTAAERSKLLRDIRAFRPQQRRHRR